MPRKTKEELLDLCRIHSGEYVPPGHPRTTFSTSYSSEFVAAAAELYSRFKNCISHEATVKLYVLFRDNEIMACRGGPMTFSKVQYLVKGPIGTYFYRKSRK